MQTFKVSARTELDRLKSLEAEIEELKRVIESNEQNYRDLYEGAPDMYRTIDADGIILDCNTAYAKSLGFSKQEVIGMSIFDHTSKDSIKKMKNSFETWKRVGHVENMEILLKRKDGTVFPGLLSANNLYDKKRKLLGSNTVIRDITEIFEARKKLENSQKQIQVQLKKLKDIGIQKEEFLAMITHELKTPLVPIKGYADILLSGFHGTLSIAQKERIEIIKSSAESLLKLIQDLLDAQKLELGKLKLDMISTSVSEIILSTITKMKPDADRHKIKITTDLEENIRCYCDKDRIMQVLTNVIFNSLDFCPEEGGTIHIKMCSEKDHAKIIVKDNGIGILKENLDKVFVKFYQVNTAITREHGGTGLGLAVCKGIIENHGGKIWARSEGKNKGTEIHILLPREEKIIAS